MSRATSIHDHCGKSLWSTKDGRIVRRFCAGIAAAAVILSHSAIYADDLSAGLTTIVGKLAASPAEVATKNVLALNTTMFDLYSTSAQLIKANILAHHPVISASSRAPVDASSSIALARRRSRRRPCRSFIKS